MLHRELRFSTVNQSILFCGYNLSISDYEKVLGTIGSSDDLITRLSTSFRQLPIEDRLILVVIGLFRKYVIPELRLR